MNKLEKQFYDYFSQTEDLTVSCKRKVAKFVKELTKEVVKIAVKQAVKVGKLGRDEINAGKFKISMLPDAEKEKVRSKINDFKEKVFAETFASCKEARDLSISANTKAGIIEFDKQAFQANFMGDWGDDTIELLDDNGIYEFMNRDDYGKTFKERLNINTNRYLKVVDAFLLIGLSKSNVRDSIENITDRIINSINDNRKAPYKSSLYTNAVKDRILSGDIMPHPGTGFSVNGLTQIDKVIQMMILGTFDESNYTIWEQSGLFLGWQSVVTSRNPCQFCIDQQFKIMKTRPVERWHTNCMCIFLPVFKQ